MQQHRVRDYMTSNVVTLTAEACLLDAALLLRRTGKRHLPILNSEKKVVGIISDRDVSRLAPSVLSPLGPEEYNQIFEDTSITRAMSKDPVTILPDAPARQAAEIMQSKKISSVLVTEADNTLVGIITVSDMLRLLNQLLAEPEVKK